MLTTEWFCRAVAAAVLVLGLLFGALLKPVPTEAAPMGQGQIRPVLGGLDLHDYCASKWGAQVILLGGRYFGDSTSWHCVLWSAPPTVIMISMDDACRHQYGPGARAMTPDRGDPYAWKCYRE